MIHPKSLLPLTTLLLVTGLNAQYVVNGVENIPTGTYAGLQILNDGDVGNVQSGAVVTLSSPVLIGQASTSAGENLALNILGGDIEFTNHTDFTFMPRANGGTATFTINSGTFNQQASYYRINVRLPDGNRGAGGDVMNFNVNGGSTRVDNMFILDDNSPNDSTESTSPIVNFTQTGGYFEYRGISAGTNANFGPDSHAYITISGGEFNNSTLTRSVTLGPASTTHIIGSAATNIEMLVLDLQAEAILKFTVDGGGITPLNIGGGANDTLLGVIDMDWSVEPSNGQIFTIVNSTGGADYSGLTLNPDDLTNWTLITGGEDLQAMYVVPEPSVMALGIASLAFGLTVLRRRQRK